MRIFFYYSFQSSRRGGFQYLCFQGDTPLPKDEYEQDAAFQQFRKRCEKSSGWQLILEKAEDDYLLMAGRLEKSVDIQRQKSSNASLLNTSFYISVGLAGTADEISPIAVKWMEAFKKDGFQDLYYHQLKPLFRNMNLAVGNTIDISGFLKQFSQPVIVKPKEKPAVSGINRIYKELKAHFHMQPELYLSAASRDERKVRRNRLEECVEKLSELESFSEQVLLYVAYSEFMTAEKTNIRIDYEYVKDFWKPIELKEEML